MSKWHPYPQEKPKVGSRYMVTVVSDDEEPFVTMDEYYSFGWKGWVTWNDWLEFRDAVTAWTEFPEPYKVKE